jgi:phosphoribosylamine--glycine ligase
MHILVLGGGAREHAIVRALKGSPKVTKVSCAPGNPGIALEATTYLTDPNDSRRVVELVGRIKPDLVIIGPEAPLAAGIADALHNSHIPVFGPLQNSARLETSKIYSKEFMIRNQIPTARAVICANKEEMLVAQKEFSAPYVVKADGLAAGKGVRICKDDEEFKKCAEDFFDKKVLGPSATKVLIEEFIQGDELSLMLLVADGKYSLLPVSQDHKKLLDKDLGPNTGGMGAFAPVKKWAKSLKKLEDVVIQPTIAGLTKDGIPYRGVLYIGVMMTKSGPFVLEYNVRFGDPEAQVLLPLLKGDWADVFLNVANGKIPKLSWKTDAAVCVVLAAPGYPDDPKKGVKILIDRDTLKQTAQTYLLHASTFSHQGLYTNGGRVISSVAVDKTVAGARKKAYHLIKSVTFEGMQFRNDIALEKGKNGRR